jgi:hypothetical protein
MYLFAVLALVVVLVNRKAMLTRASGATAILSDAETPAGSPLPSAGTSDDTRLQLISKNQP